MLITIGQKRPPADDLGGLLLGCHERIRSFVALARAAAEQVDLPDAEVVEACSRAERYFIEALPLHVSDEEESIFPRLRGRSPDVDRALQGMHEQHINHQPKLRALLDALSALRQSPRDAPQRAELIVAANALRNDFTEHLLLEETVVFPAIPRLLPAVMQAEIVEEIRARRRR
jgi:iron-sulfur cluster repair protein YtfE (RIC family)